MNQYYSIAGLTFKSEFEFTGLKVATDTTNHDVLLCSGEIPVTDGDEYKALGIDTFFAPDKLVLHVRGIVSFFVESGNKVIISIHEGADNQDAKTFFIDIILPYLLYYRGFSLIRAAGVVVDNKPVLLIGISASFKSTLAAGLAQLGYPVIGDDLIVINPHAGSLSIVPTQLPLQLWEDACKGLALDINNLTKVRNSLFKYEVNYAFPPMFTLEQGIMYRLNSQNEAECRVDKVDGIAKLNSIINNNFCYPFLKVSNQEKHNLKTCAELAKRLTVRDLCVGMNAPASTVAKLIIEDIQSCIK